MRPIPPLRSFLIALLPAGLAAQQVVPGAGELQDQGTLPRVETMRDSLPSPIYDEEPELVQVYWKAWELAFRHFHQPLPGSGFPAQFIDAAFNQNIFLWDTAFMTMFCNLAYGLVPGIRSLDNFYAKQHESGEICREINRTTGVDFTPWQNRERAPLFSRWGFNTGVGQVQIQYIGRTSPSPPPELTLDALNNPIPAWAELESFAFTGDSGRLRMVRDPLVRYYRALQKYLRQGNGLYVTDWAGMDNSPRNPFLVGGGTAVDISSQMVLFARQLGVIDSVTGNADWRLWEREADSLAAQINRLMWDPDRRFYFDLTAEGRKIHVKTIAAFWTLLAGVAGPGQSAALAEELRNPATFGRTHPVPSCAADEPAYVSWGGYWRGAVWPSTNTMVIRGLQRCGYADLAREIALKHVHAVASVCRRTGTIWENYAPDSIAPGRHVDRKPVVADMVGWSGIGPILYFMEFAVGLTPDAPSNTLLWDMRSIKRSGCERFRFNGHTLSLVSTPDREGAGMSVDVTSDGPFTLVVLRRGVRRSVAISRGTTNLSLPPE
jgi:glycogen debranching enzyme